MRQIKFLTVVTILLFFINLFFFSRVSAQDCNGSVWCTGPTDSCTTYCQINCEGSGGTYSSCYCGSAGAACTGWSCNVSCGCAYNNQGCGAYGCPANTSRQCSNCHGTWSCQCVADASCGPTCGDGSCNGGESCSSCPSDCGSCSTPGPTPTPTPVPTPTPPPYTGEYFDLKGPGGYPGIPAYGASTNLTQLNVSETGWLPNSGYNATKIYNSAYFLNAIPDGTTINTLPGSTINGTDLSSGGTATNGIYWYEYDPAMYSGADLTINSATNLGARKVVLIIKGGDVYLKANIKLTKGSGFFLLVAGVTAGGAKGNIIVDPAVGGGATSNLEGIYVADGQFRTGTKNPVDDSQLWVRGTIATYGGMNLQRDLGAANSTTPAELFEFAPDLGMLFPGVLGARSLSWQEVAP